jgi:hypothetical protein
MAAFFGLCLSSGAALAEEAAADPAAPPADTGGEGDAAAAEEETPKAVNIDVEAASAYVWRGVNLFGVDQNTQNFSIFPSITATFGGFSVGYWGAFQLSGDNKSALVDGGVGAEQDLILGYGGAITDELAYKALLTYWIYPMAKEEVAGVSTPMYIEPGVSLTYATAADLGLYLGYYRGLQDATDPYSFIYINPSVGKTLPLSGDISLSLALLGGYKIYTSSDYTNFDAVPTDDPDRAVDLTFNAGATFPFSDMYVTPQVHAAFVTRSADEAKFSDEFIAWAGVHIGYNVGL